MIKAVAINNELRGFDLEAVQKIREIETRGIPVILATGNALCITESAAIFIGTSGCFIAVSPPVIIMTQERRRRIGPPRRNTS